MVDANTVDFINGRSTLGTETYMVIFLTKILSTRL
jgi:hypothetical protein